MGISSTVFGVTGVGTGHVDEMEGDRGLVRDALARVVVPDNARDLDRQLTCTGRLFSGTRPLNGVLWCVQEKSRPSRPCPGRSCTCRGFR